ncbi:hypothetical protein B0H14DRAFT_3071954 [Mycena olivaceomarginata]|nr:hypothetical protein B0H14DRAFT_3071954 [Mycena olivaceomarginata]
MVLLQASSGVGPSARMRCWTYFLELQLRGDLAAPTETERGGMGKHGEDCGRYALVYSALDDTEEDDGKPTRARTMLAMWVRSAGRQSQAVHAVRRGFSSTQNGCGESSTERARERALQHLEATLRKGRIRRARGGLNGKKHTKSARKNITRANARRTSIHSFIPPPAFSVVNDEGLLPGN